LDLVHHLMEWSPVDRPLNAEAVTRAITSLPEAVTGNGMDEEAPLPGAAVSDGAPAVIPGGAVIPREKDWLARVTDDPRTRWLVGAVVVLTIVGLTVFFLFPAGGD
jgi:hypothetical protein